MSFDQPDELAAVQIEQYRPPELTPVAHFTTYGHWLTGQYTAMNASCPPEIIRLKSPMCDAVDAGHLLQQHIMIHVVESCPQLEPTEDTQVPVIDSLQ